MRNIDLAVGKVEWRMSWWSCDRYQFGCTSHSSRPLRYTKYIALILVLCMFCYPHSIWRIFLAHLPHIVPSMTGQIPPGPVGNAGIHLPILDTFAFDTWMILPKSHVPTGISLCIHNCENCVIERHNEESHFQTVLCREGCINHPDVGLPMRPMYDYLKHEWMAMARSDDLLKQVGPVPAFVQVRLDKIKEADKLKGVAGSMVISNLITWSPGQRPQPAVPKLVCQTLACGIKVLLHYFFDSNFESANFNIADLHMKMLAPEPSADNPLPHKVFITSPIYRLVLFSRQLQC